MHSLLDAATEARHRSVACAAGFELDKFVAEGGYKWCYRAKDISSGAISAFKVLKPNAQIDRTARELKAMTLCDHPSVARCVTSGKTTIDGIAFHYVVEDYFEHGSLEARLQSSLLTANQAKAMGVHLLSALAHLREKRLVHRDIKPANIMLLRDDVPVITDFGIVRSLGDTSLTLTHAPFGIGTLGMMPAEQYLNEKAMIDWRVDQFALGITLSAAVLKTHPYGATLQDIIDNIAARRDPSPHFKELVERARLPVLVKMVQPWPADRFLDPDRLLKEWLTQMV